jgi:hypothetical protein
LDDDHSKNIELENRKIEINQLNIELNTLRVQNSIQKEDSDIKFSEIENCLLKTQQSYNDYKSIF